MTPTWTVYTVQEHAGGGWAVIATKWTDTGPQSPAKIASRLVDATRDEAEAHAARMQRGYDRTRRGMAEA